MRTLRILRQSLVSRPLVAGACVAGWTVLGLQADELDTAFSRLVEGRSYLNGFPESKTRKVLVEDFLGLNGRTSNRPSLAETVELALSIRRAEPTEPSSFVSGQAPRSIQAKVIAWEALESLATGYLYAGNKDLLDGVRVSYPGSSSANDSRLMPKEEATVFPGTSQKQLTYARLYFQQAIKDVLSYVAEDTTGALRAGSSLYPTVPHYVTFDEEKEDGILDHDRFDDPNFGGPAVQDREASQSVAYLYGSSLERYGLATVGYADQLWRSAYAGPGAGAKRTEVEKNAMLNRAAELLRNDVHAQFLATLPLAARLSDGTDGTVNEFQQAKIDQARVSVTDAVRLRDQILAGEKPTQTALVSAWDPTSIQMQIGLCRDAYEAARLKWGGDAQVPADGSVAYELARTEQAQTLNGERDISLRNSLETQLLEITGEDPDNYGNLRSDAAREAYVQAVKMKFDRLVDERNPNGDGLRDGSLMSIQALRLIQAIREIEAKKGHVRSFVERINIERKKSLNENLTITANALVISVMDAVIATADSVEGWTTTCACGMASGVSQTLKTNLGKLLSTRDIAIRTLRLASERVAINEIQSAAVIKNLIIDQRNAADQIPSIFVQSSIASAELLQLFSRANRLVQDHAFYQDVTDRLWYRDPSLAFKLEKAEEEYRDLLQEYRIELYKLARMLEAAWTERFLNPIKQANGSTIVPLNNGSFDGFTEAESVFSIPNHTQGLAFFNALKAWDTKLREPEFRGAPSAVLWDANSFAGQPLSLRRDLFKLIDYRYDLAGNYYVQDSALERQSIQQFRAILLDLANRDAANASGFTRLRIDFPLTYNQARVILGQSAPVPIVAQNRPGGGFDQFWNHRIKKIGVKIVGKNVFAAGSTVPISVELFGNVDRIGFFPDSVFTFTRSLSTFQIPLYQRDPDKRLVGEPFFGTGIGIPAAISSTQVPMNEVGGWPLFCDNFVLRIGSQGTLRIENIEDIELYLQMEVGSPPAVAWGN
ncbi:MAG: hypothetical protein JNN07_10745 [Verrucomicrobiales bacterium]|nr:hypothetical protein [Verrucomicrobiales bacterium]